MSLFTSTSTKEFQQKVSSYQKLITEEKLNLEEIVKKKQYIEICNLNLDNSNHKYLDLANTLNVIIAGFETSLNYFLQINKDDVEAWAIEAIAAGIIDAKIDQLQEEIVIKSHIMNKEWKSIKDRLSEWKNRFASMQTLLLNTPAHK